MSLHLAKTWLGQKVDHFKSKLDKDLWRQSIKDIKN